MSQCTGIITYLVQCTLNIDESHRHQTEISVIARRAVACCSICTTILRSTNQTSYKQRRTDLERQTLRTAASTDRLSVGTCLPFWSHHNSYMSWGTFLVTGCCNGHNLYGTFSPSAAVHEWSLQLQSGLLPEKEPCLQEHIHSMTITQLFSPIRVSQYYFLRRMYGSVDKTQAEQTNSRA